MTQVRSFASAKAASGMLDDIRQLLDRAFEGDFSEDDWTHTSGGEHVVVFEGDALVAHAAVVGRNLHVAEQLLRAGYVEGVATHPDFRGRGLGALAMSELTTIIGSGFEMGALSTGRPGFYERLGWERWRGPSYVRDGDELIRTADEDAGLLVLRFGPSAAVDLTVPITCEARAGDDW